MEKERTDYVTKFLGSRHAPKLTLDDELVQVGYPEPVRRHELLDHFLRPREEALVKVLAQLHQQGVGVAVLVQVVDLSRRTKEKKSGKGALE